MNSNQNLTNSTAQTIASRIIKLSEDAMAVARDLVRAIDADPGFVRELQEQGITRRIIERFERLGRGQAHPKLAFNTSSGGQRLLKLPFSDQARILEEGVVVLDADEETTRNIPVDELTPAQAMQVFSSGHERTLAEQRTWIRERKQRFDSKTVASNMLPPDYKVHKDGVTTNRPGRWSRRLILQWLAEMG